MTPEEIEQYIKDHYNYADEAKERLERIIAGMLGIVGWLSQKDLVILAHAVNDEMARRIEDET